MACLIEYIWCEMCFVQFVLAIQACPAQGWCYFQYLRFKPAQGTKHCGMKEMVLQNIKPIWSKWGRHDRSTRPLSLSPPESSGSYLATPVKTKPMLLQMEISTGTQNSSFNYFCISVPRVDPLFGAAPCPNLISIFHCLLERFISVREWETGEIKTIRDGKSNASESSLKDLNAGNYHRIRPPASFSLLITTHTEAWTL